MKIESTPIAEEEKAIIECSLVQIGQEYWRLTNREDAPNGMIFIAKSERVLWHLWERPKVAHNLKFLFYDQSI